MIRIKTNTGWLIVSGNSPEIAAMKYGGAVTDWADLPTTGLKNGLVYNNTTDHTSKIYNEATNAWDDLGSTTITVDDALSKTSANPVQNKVVAAAIDGLDKVKVSATGTSTNKVKYITVGSAEYLMGVDVDDALESGSTNPVQNKLITSELNKKVNTDGIKTIIKITRKAYDALTIKEDNVAYYVYDDTSSSSVLQAFYDGIYPINYTVIGFQVPGVPTGVAALWEDISYTYENRYFKISSAVDAGTAEDEELPNVKGGSLVGSGSPYGVTDAVGTVGQFGMLKYSSPVAAWTDKTDGTNGRRWVTIGYDLSKGQTNTGGTTYKTTSVYKDGGAVKPLTTTVRVFRRIL